MFLTITELRCSYISKICCRLKTAISLLMQAAYACNKMRKIGTLDLKYSDINIKQNSKVTYLVYELDETLSGTAIALKGYQQNL